MNNNILYEFHHSLDPFILNIATKVFKLKSLKKPKKHYELDFLNDIGIINLLRQLYLEKADIKYVFYYYQDSRMDRESQRYESLFATLVLTIIGSVVAGIILDIYKDYKVKIQKFIKAEIIDRIMDICGEHNYKDKFLKKEPIEILYDFALLRKCYNARQMLDLGLITYNDYKGLLFWLLQGAQLTKEKMELENKFINFEINQIHKTDEINENKIYDIIKAYSKGIVYQFLDEKEISIPNDPKLNSSQIIRGLDASPGYAKGSPIFFKNGIKEDILKKNNYILFIGREDFDPENIDILVESLGVVTWNSGRTGHIPVVCRGMGKPCVIISEEDKKKVSILSDVEIDGTTGIILTGNLVNK